MITRRSVIAASPSALLFSQTAAMAQPIEPPTPDQVAEVVKSSEKYRAMLVGTEALRLVLILRLTELNGPSATPDEDYAQWARVRDPFFMEPFLKEVTVRMETRDSDKIIIDAGVVVAPTGANIRTALAEGGVGGQIGQDMVRSFYLFVQIRAVAEQKSPPANESWVCTTYPFRWFCSH
jgi:hypothetical protein